MRNVIWIVAIVRKNSEEEDECVDKKEYKRRYKREEGMGGSRERERG